MADADLYVDYGGWRFRSPFRCMCCGAQISPQQFAFCRNCPPCDTGQCGHLKGGKMFSGPRELVPGLACSVPEVCWLNDPSGLEKGPQDERFAERSEKAQSWKPAAIGVEGPQAEDYDTFEEWRDARREWVAKRMMKE